MARCEGSRRVVVRLPETYHPGNTDSHPPYVVYGEPSFKDGAGFFLPGPQPVERGPAVWQWRPARGTGSSIARLAVLAVHDRPAGSGRFRLQSPNRPGHHSPFQSREAPGGGFDADAEPVVRRGFATRVFPVPVVAARRSCTTLPLLHPRESIASGRAVETSPGEGGTGSVRCTQPIS